MSIRRGPHSYTDHFTIVSNTLARDARLSFKARGIALWLLGHSEGYRSTAKLIAKAAECGIDQIQTGLQELERCGYLTREQTRDDHGRVGQVEYMITDQPVVGSPGDGKPGNGDDQGEQDVSAGGDRNGISRSRVTPSHKKTKGLEDQQTQEDLKPSSSDADASDVDPAPPTSQADLGATPKPQVPDQPRLALVETPVPAAVDLRPDVEALCTRLATRIVEHGSKAPTVGKGWRNAARLLLDVDGRPLDKALNLIDWCQASSFWRPNVMSMSTFRAKYDRLRLQALEDHARRNGQRPGSDTRNGQHVPFHSSGANFTEKLKQGGFL